MDTTKPSFHPSSFSCAPTALAALSGAPGAPLIIDVRKNEAFLVSDCTLAGALRRDPLQVEAWAGTLPVAGAMVVYCVHGHEVSQNTAAALRQRGIDARYLEGGIEAWRAQGLPVYARCRDAVAGTDEQHNGSPA